MFGSYAMLRPIRDTMGITSGLSSLPALFWGTFVAMLAVQPIYGWLVSRYRRTVVLPALYAFFAANILAFHAWFGIQEDHTWIARVYFVWVSVFNLFVVSVFWSLMADVFRRDQAARLFGMIAAGISTGGLLGPLLAGTLVGVIGTIHLLLVSASLLLVSAVLMTQVVRWSMRQPPVASAVVPASAPPAESPAGADDAAPRTGAWGAFVQVARSPYLLGIAVFVLLLTSANTVLYLEQQRLVAAAIATPDERTRFFATLDFWVQAGALVTQFLLFNRMQRMAGFQRTLAMVPLLMVGAFGALALVPSLAMLVAATLVRRVGEFGFVRPSRDMLFTVVSRDEKYQAKNLLDTFVYRGGDALSASAFAALTALLPGVAGWAGVGVALVWLASAWWLGRRFMHLAAARGQPTIDRSQG